VTGATGAASRPSYIGSSHDPPYFPGRGLSGFFLYPNPALRPLRDLDIPVPKMMAVQAFEILRDVALSMVKAISEADGRCDGSG